MPTRNGFIPFAIILILSACQPRSVTEGAKPTMIVWRKVGSWSGKGDSQTDSFLMEGSHWRVKWETTHGAGNFKLVVNSAVSGRPLMDAVDHRGPGGSTVYVNEDPRIFYLVIEARDIDWSVTVEEPSVTQMPGSD